jgi:hypothetical protein
MDVPKKINYNTRAERQLEVLRYTVSGNTRPPTWFMMPAGANPPGSTCVIIVRRLQPGRPGTGWMMFAAAAGAR